MTAHEDAFPKKFHGTKHTHFFETGATTPPVEPVGLTMQLHRESKVKGTTDREGTGVAGYFTKLDTTAVGTLVGTVETLAGAQILKGRYMRNDGTGGDFTFVCGAGESDLFGGTWRDTIGGTKEGLWVSFHPATKTV